MNILLLLILQVVIIVTLVYFYFQRKYTYWSSRGVNGPRSFLSFGNLLEQLRKTSVVTELEWFNKYGKVYGTFLGYQPVLVIADPELIKQIVIRDFHLFVNRRKTPPGMKNLFNLEGDDWKRVRTITSPTFTSGKLRGMNVLMNRCIDKLTKYFDDIIVEGDGIIDTKKVIAGFTIDVIASTSFATETDANGDRSKENPFVVHGMGMFTHNPVRTIVNLIGPNFVKKMYNKVYPLNHMLFFRDLSKEVLKQRRETNLKRDDFVQLLIDASVSENDLKDANYTQLSANADKDDATNENNLENTKNTKIAKYLDDNEIVAQCMIFFLAGFETTASTISYCIYELAQNQVIQQRLVTELNAALGSLDLSSDDYYQTVMTKIPFLDAVIKETLRKYPPLPRLERRISVDGYQLAGLTLEKDQLITIAAYAVHHNPEYYPEPERFNPDRFMPENKHLLTPYSYMPFGQGPRNCIGMRFAYQEMKLCLAKIITQYRFIPSLKTPRKLAFASGVGLLSVKAFPLKVSKRV